MKIIGLTGTIGSGKDVAREILEKKFNTVSVKLSDLLDYSSLKKRGINITRKIQQDLGDQLRQKYGTHVLAKIAIEFMKKNDNVKIIDGIRNPGEVDFLRQKFGEDFKLIAIDAPQQIRFERIVKRNRPTDPKNWEEFVAADERDQGKNQPEYGQQVKKCIEMSDVVIQNDGSLEEFTKKVEDAVKNLMQR
ncbi:MAG: AAA family ATPase [Candidatus Aenigmatarchaeota archaeon]|nr:AAA family ATPase [Candidatus Aenigmarchaeota archaeon]